MTEPKRRTIAKADLAKVPADEAARIAALAASDTATKIATEEPKPRKQPRDRIRVDRLVDLLQADAEGAEILNGEKVKPMTLGQRRSIEILLDRALPRLSATTVSGDPEGAPVQSKWTVEFVNPTRKE